MISAFYGDFEEKQVKTLIKSIMFRISPGGYIRGNLSFAADLGAILEGVVGGAPRIFEASPQKALLFRRSENSGGTVESGR